MFPNSNHSFAAEIIYSPLNCTIPNTTVSDAILVPELIHRKYIPGVEHDRIHDIESLQQLVHAQGLYSSKQLQSVMAEFWENHFTTDYDKTYDYLDDLEDSLARDAMSSAQAAREAAQV